MSDSLVFARMPVRGRKTLASLYLQENRLTEIRIHALDRPFVLGNIYVGRVEQRKRNIGCAFVRYLEEQNGFLPVPEDSPLKEGDLLLVQVEKEAMKQKLPRLTQDLTLTGKWLVLGVEQPGLYFSRKLSPEDKNRLKKISEKPAQAETDHSGQKPWDASRWRILFRTNAARADENELLEEYENLSTELEEILRYGKARTLYSCLYQADADWSAFYKRFSGPRLAQVVTDDPDVFRTLTQIQEKEAAPAPLRMYQDPMVELYRLYNLSTRIAELDSKVVHLKSGGFLVIEETEAFVAIDVNTGRDSGRRSRAETVLRTNLEAVAEIAAQIRLRQLSGTILVDFINDTEPGSGEKLLCAMREAVREDPVPAHVIDMTALYIMEMTRQKRVRSWSEQMRLLQGDRIGGNNTWTCDRNSSFGDHS